MKKVFIKFLVICSLVFSFSSCQVVEMVNNQLDKLIDEYLPVRTENWNIVFIDSPGIEYVVTPERMEIPVGCSLKNFKLEYASENYQFLGWKKTVFQLGDSIPDFSADIKTEKADVDVKDGDDILCESDYSRKTIVILVPVWLRLQDASEDEPAHYTKVIFRPGNGTGSEYFQNILQGSEASLNACSFTCENGKFIGWAKGDGSEKVYDDKGSVKFAKKTGDNTIILTALWAQITDSKEINGSIALNRNIVDGRPDRMWGYNLDIQIETEIKGITKDDVIKIGIKGNTASDGNPLALSKIQASLTEWSERSSWNKRSNNLEIQNTASGSSFDGEGYLTLIENPDYYGSVSISFDCTEILKNITADYDYPIEGTAEKIEINDAKITIQLIKNGKYLNGIYEFN